MKETKTIYETVANIKRFSIERLTSKLVMVGYKGPKVTNLSSADVVLTKYFRPPSNRVKKMGLLPST